MYKTIYNWCWQETYNEQYNLGFDQSIQNCPNNPYPFTQVLPSMCNNECISPSCIMCSNTFFGNN